MPTPRPGRVLLTLLLVLPLAVVADTDITAASRQLAQALQAEPVVSGQFSQQRQLHGIEKPLVSSGRFVYWRDQGIYWQTDQPFPQAITYARDQTVRWAAPGIPAGERSDSRRDRQFRQMLLTLFSFDLQRLQQQFETRWHIDLPHWQLQLTPLDNIARRALSRASLSGGRFIEHLEIVSARGETLRIDFSDLHSEAAISHQRCVNQFGYSIDQCQQLTR